MLPQVGWIFSQATGKERDYIMSSTEVQQMAAMQVRVHAWLKRPGWMSRIAGQATRRLGAAREFCPSGARRGL